MTEYFIHITTATPPDQLEQDQGLQSRLMEELDKYFGTTEFGAEFRVGREHPELRGAFAGIFHSVPGTYDKLRQFLRLAPFEVIQEFCRLVRNMEDEISSAKRRSRQPWRF